MVMLRKEGYMDFYFNLKRNETLAVGALIGGVFFLYPLLWLKKYDPVHNYELQKLEGSKQVISVLNTTHYLMGEDERIKIIIDSVKRADSLPEDLRIPIANVRLEFGDESINSYPGINADNFLIYITRTEKKDSNIIHSGNESTGAIVKDEFGKTVPMYFHRGPSFFKYPGAKTFWNTEGPKIHPLIIDYEYLVFHMPKDAAPIQMSFYYKYKVESGSRLENVGQIDIDLVLHE